MSLSPESRIGCFLDGHYELVSILGVGAYGVVYTAIDPFTSTPYAVKALSKVGLDASQKKFQAREIALHARAQAHPNIVSLVEILDAPDCVYVVMEFCPEGDLFASITDKGNYVGNDQLAKRVFLQLLDAVEYCHSLGIYHRDLKPENVLVGDCSMTVKLADFGLATMEPYTADFGCGSTFYMSPECQQTPPRSNSHYASAPNDVWSLGVILVNLTCGRNPWKRASSTDDTYSAYLRDPHFLRSILPLSNSLDAVLHRIFEPDPVKRITLPELREAILACHHFTIHHNLASDKTTQHSVLAHDRPPTPQTPTRPASFNISTPSNSKSRSPVTPVATPQFQRVSHLNFISKPSHIPDIQYPPTPISPPLSVCEPHVYSKRPKRRQHIPHRKESLAPRRQMSPMQTDFSQTCDVDTSAALRDAVGRVFCNAMATSGPDYMHEEREVLGGALSPQRGIQAY